MPGNVRCIDGNVGGKNALDYSSGAFQVAINLRCSLGERGLTFRFATRERCKSRMQLGCFRQIVRVISVTKLLCERWCNCVPWKKIDRKV